MSLILPKHLYGITPPDDNCIADARTYCHVFVDHIWSRRKPVQGSGNDGQE